MNYIETIININPLEEKAYRMLMGLHLSNGGSSEVATVYNDCKKVLEIGLGLPPSKETQRVFKALLTTFT